MIYFKQTRATKTTKILFFPDNIVYKRGRYIDDNNLYYTKEHQEDGIYCSHVVQIDQKEFSDANKRYKNLDPITKKQIRDEIRNRRKELKANIKRLREPINLSVWELPEYALAIVADAYSDGLLGLTNHEKQQEMYENYKLYIEG